MCKEKPRPRCAYHAGLEWGTKREKRIEKDKAFRKAEKEYAAISNSPDATTHQVREYRRNMEEALVEYTDAVASENQAELVWQSTPTGQEALERQIEEATESGNEKTAAKLTDRLTKARTLRKHQESAGDLINAAEGRLDALTDEQQGELDSLTSDIERAQTEVDTHAPKVAEAHDAFKVADKDLDERRRENAQALIEVKAHHDKIARHVRQAYLDSGVPREMANHYTLDSVNSLQSGWEYPSQDSTDRIPTFSDEIKIKQKGSDHDGQHSTETAARKLNDDEEFGKLMETNAQLQGVYGRTIEPIKNAFHVREEARLTRDEAVANHSDLLAERDEAQRRWTLKRADIASGHYGEQVFDVDSKRFIRSAYVNEDGTTNAFVFKENIGSGVPGYVPVQKIDRDKKGSFLTLVDGERVYSKDIDSKRLRLVKPGEGAKHLFNV